LLATVYSLQQSAAIVSQHAPNSIAASAAMVGTAISTHASRLRESAWTGGVNHTDVLLVKQFSEQAEVQVARSDWMDAFKSITLGYYALPGNPNYIPVKEPNIDDLIPPQPANPQQTPPSSSGERK
jgi:hypothetical protein